MCNKWHEEDGESIPNHGTGWKIFNVRREHQLVGCFKNISYAADGEGWTGWQGKDMDEGFCFFLTLAEAERCLCSLLRSPEFNSRVILEINYWGGIGKHKEWGITEGCFEIAIAKHFQLTDRSGPYFL